MNKTKMIKTVKKSTVYNSSTIDHSIPSYTKGSLQSSSRVRRRTILGEKFDYGEKIKEKENYVLYVAGQGQEKKEIEEIEELPSNGDKNERIVEQKQIIDNYQYHETKEIKKKHSRNSQTQHKRLCDPFERIKYKKYSSYTSEPRKGGYKVIRTTNIVDKNDYSMDYLHTNKNNLKKNLSSLTVKTQRSPYSRRVDNYSNMSNSSSTNESNKDSNRGTNLITINNRSRRPMSNGGKINNFSQYERKKVNGSEKIDNYSINCDKRKQNILPQNTIKYKYDKDKDTIPRAINNKCNRIPIDISKYSNTNHRKNSSLNRVQNNHSIKLDIDVKKEKSLYEGPKYQLLGKDLPKDKPIPQSVMSTRSRSSRVRNQQRVEQKRPISMENKGYIPFYGRGTRVGGAPVPIPRPNNRNKIPKPNEERYSSIRIERNSSNTETSRRNSGVISNNENNFSISSNNSSSNSNSNMRGMRDLQRKQRNNSHKVRRKMNKVPKKNIRIQNNDNIKFPGKGIRVGSSGINRSEMITEINNTISYAEYKKFERDNMDMLEIPAKKNEIIKCFEQSLFYQGEQNDKQNGLEKRFEENQCEREDNEGMFKVIFCPVHGKKVVRYCEYIN